MNSSLDPAELSTEDRNKELSFLVSVYFEGNEFMDNLGYAIRLLIAENQELRKRITKLETNAWGMHAQL